MKYELMLIFLPDLGEEQTTKELQEIKELITSEGGEIYHEDIWGVRDFAYKIKKQDQGFYVVLNFSLDPSKIKKLENPMNLNQKLVRFLVTKTPNDYEIKTLEAYEAEAAAEEEEKEKAQDEKNKEQRKPVTPVKKEKKIVPPKVETPKKEEKEEVKEEEKEEEPKKKEEEEVVKEEKVEVPEEKPEASKDSLDDVDERLKSIINDPDISL